MDVLTSETCWALNNEIIKQVISRWSLFTQCITFVCYITYTPYLHFKVIISHNLLHVFIPVSFPQFAACSNTHAPFPLSLIMISSLFLGMVCQFALDDDVIRLQHLHDLFPLLSVLYLPIPVFTALFHSSFLAHVTALFMTVSLSLLAS